MKPGFTNTYRYVLAWTTNCILLNAIIAIMGSYHSLLLKKNVVLTMQTLRSRIYYQIIVYKSKRYLHGNTLYTNMNTMGTLKQESPIPVVRIGTDGLLGTRPHS